MELQTDPADKEITENRGKGGAVVTFAVAEMRGKRKEKKIKNEDICICICTH